MGWQPRWNGTGSKGQMIDDRGVRIRKSEGGVRNPEVGKTKRQAHGSRLSAHGKEGRRWEGSKVREKEELNLH
jgi:hypothetical protein